MKTSHRGSVYLKFAPYGWAQTAAEADHFTSPKHALERYLACFLHSDSYQKDIADGTVFAEHTQQQSLLI